jgi:hypothetical protein
MFYNILDDLILIAYKIIAAKVIPTGKIGEQYAKARYAQIRGYD